MRRRRTLELCSAPKSAPSEPRRLVVLPPEFISHADQHFKCAPLSAIVSARVCAARQQASRMPRGRTVTHGVVLYPSCKACLRGELVAKGAGLDITKRDLIPSVAKAHESALSGGRRSRALSGPKRIEEDDPEAA